MSCPKLTRAEQIDDRASVELDGGRFKVSVVPTPHGDWFVGGHSPRTYAGKSFATRDAAATFAAWLVCEWSTLWSARK